MRSTHGQRTVAAILVAAFALVGSMADARSEETDVSGRNILHVFKFEPTEVGEGQIIATVEAVGVTIDPDGQITSNMMWGQLDRVGSTGHDRGYFKRTWPDGSTTVERFEGTAVRDASGVERFEGRFEYVAGTGRYEGIKGEGSYAGTPYENGMLVADWEATMTLPAQ